MHHSLALGGAKYLTDFHSLAAIPQTSNRYHHIHRQSIKQQPGACRSFRKPDKECQLKLDLETRTIGDVNVLYCRGRFTHRDEATAFSQQIGELLPRTLQLVVELSGLEAIDSAGLGELVIVHMWAKASGCSLKLAGANPRIRELFELTNLLLAFDVHPTLDEALLSFQPRVAKAKIAVHAA
jgi:anti-sigma B factor antagonist